MISFFLLLLNFCHIWKCSVLINIEGGYSDCHLTISQFRHYSSWDFQNAEAKYEIEAIKRAKEKENRRNINQKLIASEIRMINCMQNALKFLLCRKWASPISINPVWPFLLSANIIEMSLFFKTSLLCSQKSIFHFWRRFFCIIPTFYFKLLTFLKEYFRCNKFLLWKMVIICFHTK